MNINPEDEARGPGARRAPARSGIAGRVEAASKMHTPAPKGRGLVLMVLGVVVLGALIWDFTGRGAASRAVGRGAGDGKPVVAPDDGGADAGGARAPLMLALEIGQGTLSMRAADAVARHAAMEGAEREEFGAQVLAALVAAAEAPATRAEAYEVAARFADNGTPAAAKALARLATRAFVAIDDDRAAVAAIRFLTLLPDAEGERTVAALRAVVLDAERPLDVRVEAARALPASARTEAVLALAADPNTHPTLRAALR